MRKLRIVIPGGSGQVGRFLARHFHNAGHDVTVIARRADQKPWKTAAWNGRDMGGWTSAIDGSDVVINLAGRSVNCRYNAGNRREIMESRIISTELIGRAIEQSKRPPNVWLNASTATIYRHALDRPMDEATGEIGVGIGAPSAWQFSIDVATAWERVFFAAHTPSTRKAALRSAITLFDVLLTLVRFGLGGTAGPGNQYMSWIHDADFIRSVEFLIEHEEFDGPVNLSSPDPLPNREFMRILRQAWGSKIGLPATAWMLEVGAVFIRTETELVLKSRRVVPARLLDAGYQFQFPDWSNASQDLVRRWREANKA